MQCLGLRFSENGIRSSVYDSCFTEKMGEADQFRPIWHLTDADKKQYCEQYGVTHSKCYTDYGFTRTGCCACPFGSKFESVLTQIEHKEPMLFKAVNNIFGKSYDYMRKYREFKKLHTKKGVVKNQISMFEGENL